MVASNRARFLAPIAVAAVAVGTYLLVHSGLDTHHSTATQTHVVVHRRPRHRRFAKVKFYVVQPGDSLTGIAAKTGISLQTLEALNPRVQPDSLQNGQRLRLRR